MEAGFIQGEREERIAGTAEGVGKGEGGMGFGGAGVEAGSVFFVAEGEEVVLGGGEAMKAELQVGEGVSKFCFERADGMESGDVVDGELGVGMEFLFG